MYKFLLIVLFTFVSSGQAKCNEGCKTPVKHYEDIGCEPVFAKPEDCCPTHYNCAKIEGRAADKCYFKGKAYDKGEKIDDDLTGLHCAAQCFCNKELDNDFTCANIECPEIFGANPLKPDCYRVYEYGKCCSSKTECPPFEKLATCKVGDKTYHEGERFEPDDGKCKTCICKPGFEEGKFVEPFCKDLNCGTELRYSSYVRQNYAPVYYGTNGCCPIQWESPSDIESIQGISTGKGPKCHYGTKELNVGDKVILKRFSKHSPEIDCECRIPPLVTCIQKPPILPL